MSKELVSIARQFPYLKLNLKQAGMNIPPEDYIKKALINTSIISSTLIIATLLIILKSGLSLLLLFIFVPVYFILIFLFIVNVPRLKANKKVREIDKEIIYAGRFLLIELSAGVPLFNALKNVADSYKKIGKYFQEIIDRVEVGMPIDQALNEIIDLTPSPDFRKLLSQISNSLRTGADVSVALEVMVDQISKEHLVKIKEYGRKMNPFVMFYLLIAVVGQTLGVTMIALLSSFTGLSLGLGNLIGIAIINGILQIMFLSVVLSQRPGVQ